LERGVAPRAGSQTGRRQLSGYPLDGNDADEGR
jgi:hypothetical protein